MNSETLHKLKTLMERGEKEESKKAEALLKKLLKKNNLTLKDLDNQVREDRDFHATPGQRFLFTQIVSMVNVELEIYKYRGTRSKFIIKCTLSEKLQIESLLEFYTEEFKKSLKLFKIAFIHKNNLFPEQQPDSEGESGSLIEG